MPMMYGKGWLLYLSYVRHACVCHLCVAGNLTLPHFGNVGNMPASMESCCDFKELAKMDCGTVCCMAAIPKFKAFLYVSMILVAECCGLGGCSLFSA